MTDPRIEKGLDILDMTSVLPNKKDMKRQTFGVIILFHQTTRMWSLTF